MSGNDGLTDEDLQRGLELIESIQLEYTLIDSETCVACNGSGRYDSNRSPKCGHCNGRGKTPTRENKVRQLSKDLSELNDLDWRSARDLSKSIEAHMKSIGLGWEDEYYWG
jgi:hypothetical protein